MWKVMPWTTRPTQLTTQVTINHQQQRTISHPVKLLGKMKKTEAAPATPAPRLAHIELEMSRYLATPSIMLDDDPLQWWSMHAAVRKYLCICGTSSSSERLFSVAGNIVRAKRSLLKPHKVGMLVFLAKNL